MTDHDSLIDDVAALQSQVAARNATIDRMAREAEAVMAAVSRLLAGRMMGVIPDEEWNTLRAMADKYAGSRRDCP